MNTVDELLAFIVDQNFSTISDSIIPKDKKILLSLNTQIKNGNFLTERQGNLLIKILRTYKKHLSEAELTMLDQANWSKSFRELKNFKKAFIDPKTNKIVIEYSFDKDLKKKLSALTSESVGSTVSTSYGRVELVNTEENILLIINSLSNEHFDFSLDILELYKKIKEIISVKDEYTNILSNRNLKILEKVQSEFQDNSQNFELKLLDRRFRYQYEYSTDIMDNSLAFNLANRNNVNVWIDGSKYSLIDIMSSLKTLDRFPLLLVFNDRDSVHSQEILNQMKEFLESITDPKIGIYFRFDNNSDTNKAFNQVIAELNYKSMLDDTTDIAGIGNGNLPKFLLKSKWEARTVIAFTNNFKNNKAYVYSKGIDLKIYYTPNKPFGEVHEIL